MAIESRHASQYRVSPAIGRLCARVTRVLPGRSFRRRRRLAAVLSLCVQSFGRHVRLRAFEIGYSPERAKPVARGAAMVPRKLCAEWLCLSRGIQRALIESVGGVVAGRGVLQCSPQVAVRRRIVGRIAPRLRVRPRKTEARAIGHVQEEPYGRCSCAFGVGNLAIPFIGGFLARSPRTFQ